MQILANALPGFRDLRAPLVAGYLWLLFAWLLLSGEVGTDDPVVHDVVDAATAAGKIGAFTAASVAAYLVGAISQTVSDTARSLVLRIGRANREDRDLRRSGGPDIQYGLLPALGRVLRLFGRLFKNAWRDLATLFRGPPSTRDQDDDDVARKRSWIWDAARSSDRHGESAEILAPALAEAETFAERLQLEDPRELTAVALTDQQQVAQQLVERLRSLSRELSRELDLPATLLVGDQPALFAEVDRLRAEADLRVAVAPPLIALGIAAAFLSSAWWLLLIPGALVLLVIGARRYEQSRKGIRDAMTFGKAPSAAVRNFESWLKEFRGT